MDPDSQVEVHFPPFLRKYKSGRIERFIGTSVVPPSLDPAAPVSSKDVTIDPVTGLCARLYLPNSFSSVKLPILVYFHGGAFCTESAFSSTYHHFLNPFSAKAQILVVSVNYRLAPEHKLPVAYDDSWVALQWAMSGQDTWLAEHGDPKRIFLGGDSAGANIAHQMAVRSTTTLQEIEGMILIHPYFGTNNVADAAETARFEEVWRMLSEQDIDCSEHNPMTDGGKGMAVGTCKRAMVCVAEWDRLRERGVAYFEALKGSGWCGEGEFVETEGEDHVFHLVQPGCEKGLELTERLIAFINK